MKTINRFLLDFDFEKICSETLTNLNVYACLLCGKYFNGRGSGTPAYIHSMEQDHHVFMNLSDGRVYCLPDNYEVDDVNNSLNDIRKNLNPTYTRSDIDSLPSTAISLTGTPFMPGAVGLNPIRDNSYLNAVIHVLASLPQVRDGFLLSPPQKTASSKLHASFGELIRKMYNPEQFKGTVSPHEFLQCVGKESNKEFFTTFNDPVKFLDWFLPTSVMSKLFQGHEGDTPFWTIHLDLPPMAVFKDDKNLISTVQLDEILDRHFRGKPLVSDFPDYMILGVNRFVKNDFFTEKNSTIIRYPIKGLDMTAYGEDDGIPVLYDLVAVVSHEGSKPESGNFKSFIIQPQTTDQWLECNGLRISKILPQSVVLVESYMMVWHRRE